MVLRLGIALLSLGLARLLLRDRRLALRLAPRSRSLRRRLLIIRFALAPSKQLHPHRRARLRARPTQRRDGARRGRRRSGRLRRRPRQRGRDDGVKTVHASMDPDGVRTVGVRDDRCDADRWIGDSLISSGAARRREADDASMSSPARGTKRKAAPSPSLELSARERAQLRLLSCAPELQRPHRDARGRRQAVSVDTRQLVCGALGTKVAECALDGRGEGSASPSSPNRATTRARASPDSPASESSSPARVTRSVSSSLNSSSRSLGARGRASPAGSPSLGRRG